MVLLQQVIWQYAFKNICQLFFNKYFIFLFNLVFVDG
jgi:hypothetical protein